MKGTLINLIKRDVSNRTNSQSKYFKIRKIKVFFGKTLMVYATLPLMSFWAFIPGMMLMGIKPTLWAKSKLIDFKERWRLR